MRNSLEKHLVKLVGHAKQFDATVKCNPDKPTPCHLIDNINEYMGSFKKGSALIRKVFTAANPSIIKIDKFSGKITGDRVSINQILTSFKNLQFKYLSNEYLDYKSRALTPEPKTYHMPNYWYNLADSNENCIKK